MNDAIKFFLSEQLGNQITINQISFDKTETRVLFQHIQTTELECRIIVIVEVIQADYGIASLQQAFSSVHADKTSSTGNQIMTGHQGISGTRLIIKHYRIEAAPCRNLPHGLPCITLPLLAYGTS